MPENPPNTKTRSTYYTERRIEAARENAASYDWAAERRESAVESAEEYLSEGVEGLWRRVTGQAIPRTWGPLNATQHNDWEPAERPWTVTDGEYTLPTNDFAAYRESGRDDRGVFDPDLADESLLVNEEHPELGEGWGVDDGYGFVDEPGHIYDAGDVWMPVAYYNHDAVWYHLRDALVALRDAYVYAGDDRYARAGTALLDRIADVYPELDVHEYDHMDGVLNSHGFTGQGKAVGSIWETNLVRDMISAYDAFFDAQDGDDDLVGFLSGKAETYPGLAGKDSVDGIRANVETGLVRQVLPGVKRAQIRGNFGHHQSALAMSAVVMDEPEGYTARTLEYLFRPGGLVEGTDTDMSFEEYGTARGGLPETHRGWRVTGGDMATALVDRIDRDGHGDEAAPNYNRIFQSQSQRIARILSVYDWEPPEGSPVEMDLFSHPKLRRTYHGQYPLVLLDRYTPSIGDSGKTGNPHVRARANAAAEAFERYGDPTFARVAHALNGYDSDGLHGDAFSRRDEPLAAAVDDVVDAEGPLDLPSTLAPAYGFVALRDGQRGDRPGTDDRRATWLYFGRNSSETGTSHTHADTLHLGVCAGAVASAPDLGYPERTGDWPKHDFTKGTVSHNTVLVDDEHQHPQVVAEPRLFDDADRVQLFDAAAPEVYPQTDEYGRTTAQVRIDDASYVVDCFRVAGGDEHVFSFHGAGESVDLAGLAPTAQDGGTYAGEDVPRPDHGERLAYTDEVGNGYNYLDRVARDDDPGGQFAVDWELEDYWDVREDDADLRLRLTMCTDCDEVALADGEPPKNKPGNPESLRYLLARRSGEDVESAFTSVIEPYEGERAVASVERVAAEPAARNPEPGAGGAEAVRVRLRDGRVDYVVSAADRGTTYVVDDTVRVRGAFAIYAERDGDPEYAYVADGTLLEAGDRTLIDREHGRLTGTVAGFTTELSSTNEVVVDPEAGRAALGETDVATLHAGSEGPGNGVFTVEGVADRGDRVAFDVGEQTPVRAFVDPGDLDAGYEYDLSKGGACYAPLSWEWRA